MCRFRVAAWWRWLLGEKDRAQLAGMPSTFSGGKFCKQADKPPPSHTCLCCALHADVHTHDKVENSITISTTSPFSIFSSYNYCYCGFDTILDHKDIYLVVLLLLLKKNWQDTVKWPVYCVCRLQKEVRANQCSNDLLRVVFCNRTQCYP